MNVLYNAALKCFSMDMTQHTLQKSRCLVPAEIRRAQCHFLKSP